MRSLIEIAKDIRKWYDEYDHDLLDPKELDELCAFLEQTEENDRLTALFEEERVEDYIDPSEYGGCSGHYADENMYLYDILEGLNYEFYIEFPMLTDVKRICSEHIEARCLGGE